MPSMNLTDDFLASDLEALVHAELAKGERIDWIERPIAGRMARSPGAVLLALFGVPFTAFAIFWMAMAFWITGRGNAGAPGAVHFFPLFGVPFVLVGLGLLTTPLRAYRRALGMAYAITDRRAILIKMGFMGRTVIRSFMPSNLQNLSRTELRDGSGNLVFTRELQFSFSNNNNWLPIEDVGFLAVPNVKDVEDRLRQLMAQAGAAGQVR